MNRWVIFLTAIIAVIIVIAVILISKPKNLEFSTNQSIDKIQDQSVLGTLFSGSSNNPKQVNNLNYNLKSPDKSPTSSPSSSPTPVPKNQSAPTPTPTPTPKVNEPSPNISSFSSDSGIIGDLITISGSSFTESKGSVDFYNSSQLIKSAEVTDWSNSLIKFKIPDLEANSEFQIEVKNTNGNTSNRKTLKILPQNSGNNEASGSAYF